MLVAGNWKMNGSRHSVEKLVDALAENRFACDVMVVPPSIFIPGVVAKLGGSGIAVGIQTVSEYEEGAYTGEISCGMALEFGCTHALVGHSERRQIFQETDAVVAAKFAACKAHGLTPVFCVGETLEEREAGSTAEVVQRQVMSVLNHSGIASFRGAVLAYEPVWAIGTGETATPAQAQAVHSLMRELLAQHDPGIAAELTMLYGGSVNAGNADALFAEKDIDGALVGGASLDADAFGQICAAAAKAGA